jgi:predicted regulator of Ras-like GTPase activity (Roadblock/LC7/MglB family)
MHLSSFIAGSFSATTAFSEIIGEKQNFKIFFHEGVDSHIYICNILDRYLLTLIYNSNAELGMIRYYTSQALSKLEKILLPIEADE